MIYDLTRRFSVSTQIDPDGVYELGKKGFDIVVCNRPDAEVIGQPRMQDIAGACDAAGLLFFRYPVTASTFPGSDLEYLGTLFDNAQHRVLAYCTSGTRCVNLWVASRSITERQMACKTVLEMGFDLSLAMRFLNSHGRSF